MLDIISSHPGMEIMMWIVLIAIGLDILLVLVQNLRGTANIDGLATAVTKPLLYDVLPLIILSWLVAIDGSGFLIRIWYYAAAVLIILRVLLNLSKLVRT